jgi:hydroxymethylbilane synthase
MKSMKPLRIGTRGSKLALIQTQMVVDALKLACPDVQTQIVILETTGDKTQKANLSLQKIGGKGLFADALSAAIDRDEVDLLMHSMKDLPSIRPAHYTVAAMLERGDPRDVFLSNLPDVKNIADLPQGAVFGTASPRRAAIALRRRPDIKTVIYRGNIDTRLQKLRDGFEGVQATMLARAGLERIGMGDVPQTIFSIEEFLPAAGQGAIGIEVLTSNVELIELLQVVNCEETFRCVTAERACLAVIDGDCKTSISAYAVQEDGQLHLRAQIYTEDGLEMREIEMRGSADEAAAFGTRVGEALLAQIDEADYAKFSVRRPY